MSAQRTLTNVDELAWKETILQKLEGRIDYAVWDNLRKCGVEEIYRTCRDCGMWHTFYWRCSMRWCPLCNWRISRERAKVLNVWSQTIKQPKHVVLTQRNFRKLTPGKVAASKLAFWKLRRTKLFAEVKGGCCSTEITNDTGQNSGWHLHHHLLLDVRWIDSAQLAREWGQQIGQQFGIVKVKDARENDYRAEVCKYVVKGSDLAKWPAADIAQFVHSIRGRRFFSAFGSLFKLRGQIRDFIEATKPEQKPCECGSTNFVFADERAELLKQVKRRK